MGRLGQVTRSFSIPADRLAIIAADGVFSHLDLAETADRVACALRTTGAAPGADLAEARVAFLVPPSFAHVVISRAIWLAGGIAVPLAVSHPPAELEHVIRDSQASIVVGSGWKAEALEAISVSVGARFLRTPDLIAQDVPHLPKVTISPDRRALIVYTSGTTGKPKGVVTTHGNVAAQIASLLEAWEWTSDDRALLVLPLHHVHGIINVLGCAIAAGAACEMLPQFDVEAAWERLASGEVTVFSAVPTIYTRLIDSWQGAPAHVRRARSAGAGRARLMMSGSAALPIGTLDRWREITGHTLLERYGMTEIGMALSNPLHGERRPGFVGGPLPGVDVRLVEGELEVRGPGVFCEYWGRPEETHASFHDGWFRTGDTAVVEGGAYRLLGRTNTDIIKTGGFKVSALEIEAALREHPLIRDCAVVGIPDSDWGERVCAAVEVIENATLPSGELQQWLKARLAAYKVPKSILAVDDLPRNAMSKVVKPEVARLFG
ncbi:MAG TPA: acyl-CoA synthetase [Vicinamibacterales bacterium]